MSEFHIILNIDVFICCKEIGRFFIPSINFFFFFKKKGLLIGKVIQQKWMSNLAKQIICLSYMYFSLKRQKEI